ncbi:MAG: U32 family peptidase [Bacteriovoracaceae bacterium]
MNFSFYSGEDYQKHLKGSLLIEADEALVREDSEFFKKSSVDLEDIVFESQKIFKNFEIKKIQKFLQSDAIPNGLHFRVRDFGFSKLLSELSETKGFVFDLNLELNSHNIPSIVTWEKLLGPPLKKFVVSSEIPHENLKKLLSVTQKKIELLGLGRILIFYSDRELLTSLGFQKKDGSVSVTADGQETAHQNFQVVENDVGTLMYAPQDHCILEFLDELEELGVDSLKLDTRHLKSDSGYQSLMETICSFVKSPKKEDFLNFKASYPKKLTRGFFKVNKSDVLFKKLKNRKELDRKSFNHIGNILEVKRGEYMVFQSSSKERPLKRDDKLFFLSPDGRQKELTLSRLKSIEQKEVESTQFERLYLLPHLNSLSVGTKVYVEGQDL